MRVVVNQLASLGVKTGIGHYTVELLRGLSEIPAKPQISAVRGASSQARAASLGHARALWFERFLRQNGSRRKVLKGKEKSE